MPRINLPSALRMLCVATLLAGAAPLGAQTWPVKPLRYVISFPPGGSNDILARILGARIQELVGQPVLVDNRPGAGGNIGAEAIARAAPDGHTVGNISATHAINATLYPKLGYDVLRDFTTITLLTEIPLVLAVHPALAARTVKELIALSQSRRMSYASSGIGTPGHLAAEMLRGFGAKDLAHVPHKGGAPAIVDLIAGHVDLLFINLPELVPHLRAGKMRGLAIAGARRDAVVPEVPTFVEQGFDGFVLSNWFGLVGPAGVPASVVATLHGLVDRIVKEPGPREKIEAQGFNILTSTPAGFAAHLEAEHAKWAKLVRLSGAKVE